jgi:DNA-binding GntR family transcriptional regulator
MPIAAALARLVGEDPLAPAILAASLADHPDSLALHVALAIVVEPADELLVRAHQLATTRRDRQHLAVVEGWLRSDRDRARLLAREHLSEFPDDLVVSWLLSTQ